MRGVGGYELDNKEVGVRVERSVAGLLFLGLEDTVRVGQRGKRSRGLCSRLIGSRFTRLGGRSPEKIIEIGFIV